MSLIVERIHNGETSSEIGISTIEYTSRKELLDSFLKEWDEEEFLPSYLKYISSLKNDNEMLDDEIPAKPSENKVKSFATDMKKFVGSGFKLADKKVQKKRYNDCLNCSHLTPKGRCDICGCFMKVKTRVETAKCPLSLW